MKDLLEVIPILILCHMAFVFAPRDLDPAAAVDRSMHARTREDQVTQ